MKLFLWAALILVVLYLLNDKRKPRRPNVPSRNDARPGQPGQIETMVRCDHCGVYLPASEAVTGGHATFCSDEHRLLHPPV